MTKNTKLVKDGSAYSTADVKFHKGPMMLPDDMTHEQAYKMLGRLIRQQEEETSFSVEFDCLPQDGAAALNAVLVNLYGWSTGIPTPGFFGPEPPEMMTVHTDVDITIQVPWGRLALPNLDKGFVHTGLVRSNGLVVFQLSAVCKRNRRLTSLIYLSSAWNL